jgi:ferritin-like metal-binding protein YciE
MQLNSLQDLYVSQLKDVYDAEQQITQALPKMASAASTPELKDAFNKHLQQTRGQIDRLDKIFRDMDMSPGGKTCKGMKGLIEEGEEVLKANGDAKTKDAALIEAAQKVEHYEIATYGSLRTYADELGYDDAADLLQETLDEEGKTNKMLTDLATGGILSKGINVAAER